MFSRFDRAFDQVIGHEGGYTRRRSDKGNWTGGKVGVGELKGTKFGISAATYPDLDIRNLTREAVRPIYRRDFWDRCQCDALPEGCAYAVFDAAVNHGRSRSIRWLQTAVGAAPDGIIGPNTRRKVAAADPVEIIREMLSYRVKFYMDLDNLNDIYGLGWSRRSVDVVIAAITYAGAVQPVRSNVSADDLLAAYMDHEEIETGSARHRIAGALRDLG